MDRQEKRGFLLRIHGIVKEVEPCSVLLAVVALFLSLAAFWFDYTGRVEERTVRAWQLLSTKASGNSGKSSALEFFNEESGLLCFDLWLGYLGSIHVEDDYTDLVPEGSRWFYGGNFDASCLILFKGRTPLTGIDLSPPSDDPAGDPVVGQPGTYLRHIDLRKALLWRASFRHAEFHGADFRGAVLWSADLCDAELPGADSRALTQRP